MRPKLALIDGHSLAYRMYFALERTGMKTSQKVPSWATYGFFKALFDFIKQAQPDGMMIAFDKGRNTFRNELYPEYKAHRESMPDAMRAQMGDIRRGIEALHIPIVEMVEFEADDLIGTLAIKAKQDGFDVTVLTGDQDAFQIIDPDGHIALLMPGFSGGLSTYNRDKVIEKWGITPEQVVDFKALKGDTSDNIPGVPGVGDKTAAKLLQDYGTLEAIYDNIADIKGKLQEKLVTFKDQAFLSQELARIRLDAPVDLHDQGKQFQIGSLEDFLSFLGQMEFRTLLQSSPNVLMPYLTDEAKASLPAVPSSTPPAAKPVKAKSNGQASLFGGSDTTPQTVETSETGTPPGLDETYLPEAFVPPHSVVTSEAELAAFLEESVKTGLICLDIETTGLDPLQDEFVGIAFSYSPQVGTATEKTANPLQLDEYPTTRHVLTAPTDFSRDSIVSIYVPMRHAEGTNLAPEKVFGLLKPLLEDDAIVKVAHNGKFERAFFLTAGITCQGLVFDTMLASYVLNSERGQGLKSLGFDVLGIHMAELKTLLGSGKNQKDFSQLRVEEASPYASLDTYVTLALAAEFTKELDTEPELKTVLYELELPLLPVLGDMERNGISLDELYLRHLSEQLGVSLVEIEEDIYQQAGMRFNVNSPKQVADVLFGHLQIPSKEKNASKSGLSTNAKILEGLADDYPVVQRILDYRQLFKLKSTYVDALPQLVSPKDHRIHTSFNQAVAATGRLSSSNPNLQNIPIRSDIGRSIRKAFVPRDSKQFHLLSADYSQIELRLLAHFSQDPNLVEAFQAGLDIHKATAALVFGVPLEAVTKEMRYQAKTVNFGVIYGQTAFGLSQTLGIFPGEAAAFIETYFDQYPSVKAFIEETKQLAYDTGRATTIYGRMRDVREGLESKQKYVREFTERAAFNTPLQGSAADLVKLAMIRLQERMLAENVESKLILQVHDEVVLEAHLDELDWLKETVAWAMELEQPLHVPLVVDIATGPNWMEAD